MIAISTLTAPASAEGWGVAYRQPGQAPAGNVSNDALKAYDALYMDDSGEKKIYLTFDAGYENGYTSPILDILKKHDVPATFFLVGHYIKTAPDLVKRMVDEGHIVGNHTYSHPNMSKISDHAAFQGELENLEKLYRETTGENMLRFYRPPEGEYSLKNLEYAKKTGYKTVFWSLAYVDWDQNKQPSREDALKKLVPRIHPGAIILLHSTSKTNAEILDELIIQWKGQGYTFEALTAI
ncbi:MAG: polysaccharide deacetylase family protein [Oscillospiraceae bacterium]|nr:polysaccharide deacetylase family protein [Oscillospiraceae bacterium]